MCCLREIRGLNNRYECFHSVHFWLQLGPIWSWQRRSWHGKFCCYWQKHWQWPWTLNPWKGLGLRRRGPSLAEDFWSKHGRMLVAWLGPYRWQSFDPHSLGTLTLAALRISRSMQGPLHFCSWNCTLSLRICRSGRIQQCEHL